MPYTLSSWMNCCTAATSPGPLMGRRLPRTGACTIDAAHGVLKAYASFDALITSGVDRRRDSGDRGQHA